MRKIGSTDQAITEKEEEDHARTSDDEPDANDGFFAIMDEEDAKGRRKFRSERDLRERHDLVRLLLRVRDGSDDKNARLALATMGYVVYVVSSRDDIRSGDS